jgi:hypothetical protein
MPKSTARQITNTPAQTMAAHRRMWRASLTSPTTACLAAFVCVSNLDKRGMHESHRMAADPTMPREPNAAEGVGGERVVSHPPCAAGWASGFPGTATWRLARHPSPSHHSPDRRTPADHVGQPTLLETSNRTTARSAEQGGFRSAPTTTGTARLGSNLQEGWGIMGARIKAAADRASSAWSGHSVTPPGHRPTVPKGGDGPRLRRRTAVNAFLA